MSFLSELGGLLVRFFANPTKISKQAVLASQYLAVRFGQRVVELTKLGIARPFGEIADSKLEKLKKLDRAQAKQALADATKTHNEGIALRQKAEAEAELIRAQAARERAEAEKTLAQARAIDGPRELNRVQLEQEAARERAERATERVSLAVEKLRLQGGDLYLEPPSDDPEPNDS